FFCRLGKRAVLGNGGKVSELTQFHGGVFALLKRWAPSCHLFSRWFQRETVLARSYTMRCNGFTSSCAFLVTHWKSIRLPAPAHVENASYRKTAVTNKANVGRLADASFACP